MNIHLVGGRAYSVRVSHGMEPSATVAWRVAQTGRQERRLWVQPQSSAMPVLVRRGCAPRPKTGAGQDCVSRVWAVGCIQVGSIRRLFCGAAAGAPADASACSQRRTCRGLESCLHSSVSLLRIPETAPGCLTPLVPMFSDGVSDSQGVAQESSQSARREPVGLVRDGDSRNPSKQAAIHYQVGKS